MRIGLGGYTHETNTFSNIVPDMEMINSSMLCGENLVRQTKGTRTAAGGVLDEAEALGIEVVPTTYVGLMPCAPTERKTYEYCRDLIVSQLWQAHCQAPLDGIVLLLHGAGVAEGYEDLEADLLSAVREKFGNDMPIGINLDLHANISQEMIDLADVTVGYKCYPHVDIYDSCRDVVRHLHRRITGKKAFGKAFIHLPLVIAPIFGMTVEGPAKDIRDHDQKLVNKNPALLDVSFFHGFTYADVPSCGASVVVTAETQEAADKFAREAAKFAWAQRRRFAAPTNSAQQAVDLAEKADYPVVINESSDNPGGGTPGDGTHLLRELLNRNIPGTAFGFILDPQVVDQAIEAGVGSTIDCLLGGKTDKLHGEPIALKGAYVKAISDGTFIQKNPMGQGAKNTIGTSVLLVSGNVQIVVGTNRTQTKDDGPFRVLGIDWQEMRILALKSTQHFRGWWQDRAKTIIPCDSPGIHSADLASFQYKKINKNCFPFADVEWN